MSINAAGGARCFGRRLAYRFTIAAVFQPPIACTKFSEAPLAYTLSALAAVVYLVAMVGLARSTDRSRRVAVVSCTFELVGVLAVGTASLVDREAFPDQTVWSVYGIGYGFVPLVLPVLGLLWLRANPEPSNPEERVS